MIPVAHFGSFISDTVQNGRKVCTASYQRNEIRQLLEIYCLTGEGRCIFELLYQ